MKKIIFKNSEFNFKLFLAEKVNKKRMAKIKKIKPKNWEEVSEVVYAKTVEHDRSYNGKLSNLFIVMNGANGMVIITEVRLPSTPKQNIFFTFFDLFD